MSGFLELPFAFLARYYDFARNWVGLFVPKQPKCNYLMRLLRHKQPCLSTHRMRFYEIVGAALCRDHIRLSRDRPASTFDGNLSLRQYAIAEARVASSLWSKTGSNLDIRAIWQSSMRLVSPILGRERMCIRRLLALQSLAGRRC